MNNYEQMNDRIRALVLIESANELIQSLLSKIDELKQQNLELKIEIEKFSNPK